MDTQDFSLKIHPPRGRSYPVSALESPAGQGKGRMRLPPDLGDLRYSWEELVPDWSAFEREDGASLPIIGPLVGDLLGSLPELLLIVLACETARLRLDGRQPYFSVATALVQTGIPAVVAMSAPVHDRAAVAFSARLFERLSAGVAIEVAVTEARMAISMERPETVG